MNSGGWRISINEKEFIHEALRAVQRIDGRRPFDLRQLTITFAKQDGAVEVVQGQMRVMAVVTGELVAPYPDRPSLNIFTEFSPMADPSFEPGRPGELAIELGRIIDRGLRWKVANTIKILTCPEKRFDYNRTVWRTPISWPQLLVLPKWGLVSKTRGDALSGTIELFDLQRNLDKCKHSGSQPDLASKEVL